MRQVLDVIHGLPDRMHVIGADLVELNPARDLQGMSAMVAAKLVKEMIGKILSKNET